MKAKAGRCIALCLLFSILVSACQILPPIVGPSALERERTAIVQTIEARLTQQFAETQTALETQGALPTLIPTLAPTLTTVVEQAPTQLPLTQTPPFIMPTYTPILPSVTPTRTPTPTLVPTVVIVAPGGGGGGSTTRPADWVELVKVVSPASDALVISGSKVTQTWRLKNAGTSTWTNSYALVYTSGNAMNANTVLPLSTSVRPGETVDLSVVLTAPNQSGIQTGYWMLRNSGGKLFGTGSLADQPFAARLNVIAYKTTEVPKPDFPVDFTALICSAKWIGSFEKPTLPCKNFEAPQAYWAAVTLDPKFEDGKKEDERAIWVHLDGKKDGWIQAIYPAYTVRTGDHFISWIGCLDGSTSCDVRFSLDYMTGFDYQASLGRWEERYDGKIRKLDIDLSSLAGKPIKLLLGITNRSANAADAFWFIPSIQNASPLPTATLTPTQTLTKTVAPTATSTATSTATATPTSTATATATSTATSTATPTSTSTATSTATATSTPTP